MCLSILFSPYWDAYYPSLWLSSYRVNSYQGDHTTEYSSIALSMRVLFWWRLGGTNLGDRDEAENKRLELFLAKGLCIVKFPWPLPSCRVLIVLNALSFLFSFGQR